MLEILIKILEIAFIPVILVFLNFYLNKKFLDLKKDISVIKSNFNDIEEEEKLVNHLEDLKCCALQRHYNTDQHGIAIVYFCDQIIKLLKELLHFDISTRAFMIVKILIINRLNAIKEDLKEYISEKDIAIFYNELENFFIKALLINLKQIYDDLYNSKKTRITNEMKMFLLHATECFSNAFEKEEI